jgi:hypothetical protein
MGEFDLKAGTNTQCDYPVGFIFLLCHAWLFIVGVVENCTLRD